MVSSARLELATNALEKRGSIQLSYEDKRTQWDFNPQLYDLIQLRLCIPPYVQKLVPMIGFEPIL